MFALTLETHTTPSGRHFPVNSEDNRNRLSAAYLAEGDTSMNPVLCGFWLLAIALDPTTKAWDEVQAVAHRTQATWSMHKHCAIAVAMRVKIEQPELFRTALAAR
jgi:hypothetical protein